MYSVPIQINDGPGVYILEIKDPTTVDEIISIKHIDGDVSLFITFEYKGELHWCAFNSLEFPYEDETILPKQN